MEPRDGSPVSPPMRIPFATLTLAVLLASCARNGDSADAANAATPAANAVDPTATGSATAPAPAQDVPAFAVEGEGLRLFNAQTGAARPLPFGTPRAAVMAALAARPAPETGRLDECGAGPLDFAGWSDGLKLYFQESKFAGWALDRRAAGPSGRPRLGTAAGIGPGSSRAALSAALAIEVEPSSLGTEFTSGGISGVLDGPGGDSKITDLWAGADCVMR